MASEETELLDKRLNRGEYWIEGLWSLNRQTVVDKEIGDLTLGGFIRALYRENSSLRNEYQP